MHGIENLDDEYFPHNGTIAPQNGTIAPQNVTIVPQNVTIVPQNGTISPDTEMVTSSGENVSSFTCKKCSKNFNSKWNLDRHLSTCKSVPNSVTCPKCLKVFSSRHSKSRHVKTCNGPVSSSIMEVDDLQVAPSFHINGSHAPIIQNITHNHNTYIQVNVQVKNFGEEDMSHVKPQLIYEWLMQTNGMGMFNFFKHVHLNENVPQNHNIRDHPQRNMLEIQKDGKWLIVDREAVLEKALKKYRCQMIARSGDPEFKRKVPDEEDLYKILQNHLDFGATSTPNDFYRILRMIYAEIMNIARNVEQVEHS